MRSFSEVRRKHEGALFATPGLVVSVGETCLWTGCSAGTGNVVRHTEPVLSIGE
jgi:hypothetical protein